MSKSIPLCVATQRINGNILPDTLFVPASEQDHADLVALGAVREPTEAEVLLHEQMQKNAAASESAPSQPASTGGRGRRAAAQLQPAGDAGNGDADAGSGDDAAAASIG